MTSPDSIDQQLCVEIFEEGQDICRQSPVNCLNYHYLRPLLRRIGAVATPWDHASFYEEAIGRVESDHERLQVLISGSADYSWLLPTSPLRNATRQRQLAISAVDICTTPLIKMNRLKDGTNEVVNWHISDIRYGLDSEKADLIVTDAFLTQFQRKQDRIDVMRSWRGALNIGGYVVTTAQVQNTAHKIPVTSEEFLKNAVKLYEGSVEKGLFEMGTDEFLSRLQSSSSATNSRIYNDNDEIIAEAKGAELKVVESVPLTVESKTSQRTLLYRGLVLAR